MAHTSNPALGRQRQADFCEFKASLVYKASSRTAGVTQRNSVSKTKRERERVLNYPEQNEVQNPTEGIITEEKRNEGLRESKNWPCRLK